MGSWSVYCGISQIAIAAGQKCVLLPLKKVDYSDTYLKHLPATLPIFGDYNDYGELENIEENENTKFIEEYFGCTIEDFCSYFTRPDDVSEEDFKNFSEMEKWNYMFIDRQVYDFMSSHSHAGYGGKGALEFGNKQILELIGFTYLGATDEVGSDGCSEPQRYKHVWEFGGERFFSDGEWLHHKNGSVYNFTGQTYSNLTDYVSVPEDKMWIGEKTMWQLWKHLDEDKRYQKLSWIFGVDYGKYIYGKMMKKFAAISSAIDPEDSKFCLPKNIASKYLENMETFGDAISGLVSVRNNLHCMSGTFAPYVLYITPQCGEFEQHQVLLEKFVEINKTYLREDE